MSTPGERDEVSGPPMLVVTRVLKGPEQRLSRLPGGIRLHRSIPIRGAAMFAAGSLLGLVIGAIFFRSFSGALQTAILAGAGMAALSNWQPLTGESWGSFLGLGLLRYRRRTAILDGHRGEVAIGISRVGDEAYVGDVLILPGVVDVDPDAYDERAALRTEANQNLL